MYSRREFLKTCFKIGGYAGIASLGIEAVYEAQAYGILHAVGTLTGGGAAGGFTAGANIYVCDFKQAAGNETGSGLGLAGADLVLTENGDPAAAAQDGNGNWYRTFDGTADNFDGATNLANTACSGAGGTYTIGIKLANLTDEISDAFIRLRDATNENQLMLTISGAGSTYGPQLKVGNVWKNPAATANNMSFGSAIPTWILGWADGGVNNVRFAFTATDPVLSGSTYWNWSTFAAGDRTEATDAGNFNGVAWANEVCIGGATGGAGGDIIANVYKVFFSNLCLVNNAA